MIKLQSPTAILPTTNQKTEGACCQSNTALVKQLRSVKNIGQVFTHRTKNADVQEYRQPRHVPANSSIRDDLERPKKIDCFDWFNNIARVRASLFAPQRNDLHPEICKRLKAAIDEGNIGVVHEMLQQGLPLHELKIDGRLAWEYAVIEDENEISNLLFKKPTHLRPESQ